MTTNPPDRALPTRPEDLPGVLAAALDSGDPSAVAGLFGADAAVLLPGARLAAGRDAVRAAFARAFADGFVAPVGQNVTVLVAGVTACVTDTDDDGCVRTAVARLDEDGVWRYVQDSMRLAEWVPSGCGELAQAS